MNLAYTSTITADEVNTIRASVGFRRIHPEQVQAGLEGSALIVAARDEGKVVGRRGCYGMAALWP